MYRCNAFGKPAEICSLYLRKGSHVLIVGKMQQRKYKDKEGQDRESWELKADQMTMLGSAQPVGQRQHQESSPAPQRSAQGAKPTFEDLGDDIPFNFHAKGRIGHCM